MSLILDALRKSEAERRRGQAPDLFASLPVPAASRRPDLLRFWPWPVFVALVLGAGYVLWPDHEEAMPAIAETMQSDAVETDMQYVSPLNSQVAMPPSTTLVPVVAAAVAPLPVAAQPSTGQPAVMSPAPFPPQTSGAATPVPPAPTYDGDGESLPPITVLAASERAGLPPLKLSMHVWNNEPGKRFVIIDGQRVTEGSTVGSGGIIEEIRRDGVVLNINGHRVLLPRP